MVTVLGLTVEGKKIPLGFVQTGTENATTCTDLLRSLMARGLRTEANLLVVIDGGKGLRAAVTTVFGADTPVQGCTYHKGENVVSYLPKSLQAEWRGKLAHAYAQPTYAEARAELAELRAAVGRLNESAVRSLDEGLEETLTVYRLGMGATLRRSLMTTNMLESVFSGVEQRTGKVDRWRNSNQKQRSLAAALLHIEPRLRRVRGYRDLPRLREAIRQHRGQPDNARRRTSTG